MPATPTAFPTNMPAGIFPSGSNAFPTGMPVAGFPLMPGGPNEVPGKFPRALIPSFSGPTISASLPQPTGCNHGGAQPTFMLAVSDSGTEYDGQWAIQNNRLRSNVMTFGAPESASTFTFTDKCSILAKSTRNIGFYLSPPDTTFYFTPQRTVVINHFPRAVCDIQNNALECEAGTGKVFYLCDGEPYLQIGEEIPSGCGIPTLQPLYITSV